jgi:hypothetical protein
LRSTANQSPYCVPDRNSPWASFNQSFKRPRRWPRIVGDGVGLVSRRRWPEHMICSRYAPGRLLPQMGFAVGTGGSCAASGACPLGGVGRDAPDVPGRD